MSFYKIVQLLNKAYGRPRRFVKTDPVDELVRTILSQNTNDRNSLKAFAALKKRFRQWDGLLALDNRKIALLIKGAGLSNIKSKRIKEALAEVKRREGRISLERLRKMSVEESLEYLRTIKGVGPKTASCVLLFSFGKKVMPVDTHIFRVAGRLGLIAGSMDIEEAHKFLTNKVPKGLIYEFHLGIIEHGQKTCKAQNPRCGFCVLYEICCFKYRRSMTRYDTQSECR